ncbi:MAG: TolC family protein [Campylobacterales bacterium]|nr:TolC family protein [Campylobacterales bacterium]
MIRYFFLTFILIIPLSAGLNDLRLQDAIEILKRSNLELKSAEFDEKMKYYEAQAVSGMKLGKLDAQMSAMRSNDAGNVFGFKLQSREANFGDFGAGEFDPSNPDVLTIEPYDLNYPKARNHYLTKLTYSIPLYTSGKIYEYGKIAKKLALMSKLDTKKVLQEKIYEVKKTFYDIGLIEEYIKNLSLITRNIKQLEQTVQQMKKEGFALESDFLEVQAQGAEAESMFIQAKLNKDLAYQYLSFLLNQDVTSIVAQENSLATPKIITKDDVVTSNLDIEKAKMGLEVSKRAVSAQRANFGPSIGGFAEYGSADNEVNFDKDKDFYTVGVQLSWNIFNGGSDYANLERAKVEYLKTQKQVELAQNGIYLQAKKLQTEILSTKEEIKSYQTQYKFASRVYDTYNERYKEGIVPISDVLIKQSKKLEVMTKLLSVKNKYNTKIFELDKLLNRGEEI